MVLLFKVWNASRTIKNFVCLKEEEDKLYDTLILKASEKMKINGSQLVLESDGTLIDDDEVLRAMVSEILILLEPGQSWRSVDTLSNCSTLTVNSGSNINVSTEQDNFPLLLENESAPETCSTTKANPWRDFAVPWQKVSKLGMEVLKNNIRNEAIITEVTHIVADEIRAIQNNIPSKYLRNIAQDICKIYPATFEDRDDDGVLIGDGYHGLFYKIQDRIKYLNRSCRKRNASEATVPIHKAKKMMASKAGCSHWNPSPDSETSSQEIENAQKTLKSVIDGELSGEIINILELTYPTQRRFLNNPEPPSLKDIRNEWPVLLSQNGIFWHFNKLLSKDINDLTTSMLQKSEKILHFGIEKKYITTKPTDDEDDILLCILKVLSSFFVENLNLLYVRVFNETIDFEAMHTMSPFIISVQEKASLRYYVVMEKERINEGNASFKCALQQTFALYYNFNLAYPKGFSSTLEFLQSYFLKIRPTAGSKGTKNSKMKLLSLMNKLRNK